MSAVTQPKPIVMILIRATVQRGTFDLVSTILSEIQQNGQELEDGDILAVSSKFISMSEGRVADLSRIKPGQRARQLAKEIKMDPALAELVVRESQLIYSGVKGFALAIKEGIAAPNAGIDRSNVFPGYAMLYPRTPFQKAAQMRGDLLRRTGRNVGVVITDSRLMPTRIGTSGVALGVAGFTPVIDDRGRKDLFGNTLKVTQRAIADNISSAAQLLMGEADEAVPVVIIRGTAIKLHDETISPKSVIMPQNRCIFCRGLSSRVIMRPRRLSKA